MPYLNLKNVKLWYEQSGAGQDIFWIPGGDNVASDWSYQTNYFKASHRNTSLDPRGAGKTEIGDLKEWSINDMADDCAALIKEVCKPPVYVIGISMGGLIALQLAISHPQLVKLCIPMGAASHCTGFSRSWMKAEIDFRKKGGTLTPEFARHHYGVFMYPPEVIDNDKLWDSLVPFISNSYGERENHFLIGQWQACVDFDVSAELPKCETDLHFIGFSLDIQCPPSLVRRSAQISKRATYHHIDGLGHLSLMGHKPNVVNKKISDIIGYQQ